jgi:acyl-CoA synthetase (AMP-forming)/AMP-acid ligase II
MGEPSWNILELHRAHRRAVPEAELAARAARLATVLDGLGLREGDRKSDMTISGGVNVYPTEIDAVIQEHPGVADCAMFGVPDDEWGECVHASVQLEPTANAEGDVIRGHCRARLADYEVPRFVELAGELPRQTSGEIYERKLRETYWVGRDRRI